MYKPKIMEFMTVKEIVTILKKVKTIILPIGCIEQHGYHLPLNTDVYNAYELAKIVSKVTGCVIAPPIVYTFSGGTLAGTINVNPAVLSLYIQEIIREITRIGFKNIILLLGHAGTESEYAIRNAADIFLRQNPEKKVNIAIYPCWVYSKTVQEAFKNKDFHSGCFETSLMLYWHPELVHKKMIRTDSNEIMEMFKKDQDAYQVKEKLLNHEAVVPYIKQHPKIKIGVMGEPKKASYKLGKQIVKECITSLTKLIKAMERKKHGR